MSTAPQGWQNPKTNWQAADIVHPSDVNRIEGNIQAIESGSRTLDPSQVPSGNSGSLRQILSWFANRLKAITGAANWYDAPATTLAATKSHIDATTGIHGATSSATANRLIIRDSNGRASVADPTSSSHIATKGYVDNNFAPIYPTIYSVDFDGTIEIEAGGFIEREVVIPSSLVSVRFGVIHTLPPGSLTSPALNQLEVTVGRRLTGTILNPQPVLVVRLWNRRDSSLSTTASFTIYLMIILFP